MRYIRLGLAYLHITVLVPFVSFWRVYLLYSSNLTLFPLTYFVVTFLGEYSGRFRSMKSKFGHLIFYRSHLQ